MIRAGIAALILMAGPALAQDLGMQDVVILGEVHDNPAHHLIQAERVAEIAPAALVFEMLTPAQAAAAARLDWQDEAALGAALDWEESGWPDFSLYHPIFAAAPRGAALYGAALSREEVRRAMSEGAAAVFEQKAGAWLGEVSPQEQVRREAGQMAAHCNALPEEILSGMVEAQRLRDAHFARIVLKALDETGGPVVLITGTGHARTDWGVPAVLARIRPEVNVHSVGMIEEETDAPFDEVIATAPAEREDPCAAFR